MHRWLQLVIGAMYTVKAAQYDQADGRTQSSLAANLADSLQKRGGELCFFSENGDREAAK